MTDRSGNLFETECLKFLREEVYSAERLAKTGREDEGDLAITLFQGRLLVAELKARRSKTNQLTLGSFMAEAIKEAEHYERHRDTSLTPLPMVILKRPGKSIGDCFAILRLKDFVRL